MGEVFVTGGTGFIGAELVRHLVRRGERVSVLARTEAAAAAAEALGARAVPGDLLVPGRWQEVAAFAERVVHVAQPETFGARVTRARANAWRDARLAMDHHLLGALADAGRVARVLYVAGTSYYGHQGRRMRDEDARPRPRGWGPYLAPAIDRLATYALPLVVAFPGYVYGAGSWFGEYVARPLRKGKTIHMVMGRSRLGSPVHVRDCARALAHLLHRGEVGRRYFVVDDEPITWRTLYRRTADALGVPLHVRWVPSPVVRMLVGSLVTESFLSDAVLSNARLKRTGFELEWPTTRTGIPAVLREMER